MGALRIPIEVGDPQGQKFETVEALVDTGSTFSIVPAGLLHSLGVTVFDEVPMRLADGSLTIDQVGNTMIRLEGKRIITPVIFGREGEPSLLGVVALETALLAVDPVNLRLISTEGLKMSARIEAWATRDH